MPKLIRNGAVVEEAAAEFLSLEQVQAGAVGSALILEPGEAPDQIPGELSRFELIALNFPVFMDGRGFSYARELRELGFGGEIRAIGNFIRDQLFFLKRCGVDTFELGNEQNLEEALASFADFSDSYQAAIDQPEPLFRRR